VPNELVLLPALKQLTLEGNPLKGIRVDILQRGTVELLRYLRGKLKPSELVPQCSDSDTLASNQVTPRGARAVSSEKDLGVDVHMLKNSRSLTLVSKNIKALDEHIFVTAVEAKVNKIDFSRNSLTELPTT
jgi:hypothetical protein